MEYTPPDDIKHWYYLVPVPEVKPVDEDVPMVVEGSAETVETAVSPTNAQANEASEDDEPTNKTHDNIVVSYIDVIGRVRLECFRLPPRQLTFHSFWKDFSNTFLIAKILSLQAMVSGVSAHSWAYLVFPMILPTAYRLIQRCKFSAP